MNHDHGEGLVLDCFFLTITYSAPRGGIARVAWAKRYNVVENFKKVDRYSQLLEESPGSCNFPDIPSNDSTDGNSPTRRSVSNSMTFPQLDSESWMKYGRLLGGAKSRLKLLG